MKRALLCFVLFTTAAVLVSVHRFWQYEVFYYDFGIFDTAIWNVSRLKPPIIDHLVVSGKWIFADHFSPTIFLLSPLYWLTNQSEIILIAQAVIVGLSGLVLYTIGVSLLKNQFLSLATMISYYLFVGLQNAVITDFHEVTILGLPFLLTIWAIIKEKKLLYVVFLLATLGIKESTFLLGLGIAFYMLMIKKSWWKMAIGTVALSLLWGYVAINVIIPYFAGSAYSYTPTLPAGILPKITALFDEPIKRKTLLFSFMSFSFLPLFSLSTWPLILQDFVVRFVPQNTNLRWDLGLHYSAQLAPILALSTLMTLVRFQTMHRAKRFVIPVGIIMIALSGILHQFILHGPLGLSYNRAFYRHTNDFTFLDTLVAQVPKNASVMAQNNIAVRFTHQKSWLLRNNPFDLMPDYIIMDTRDGQNPNNFFGTGDTKKLVEELLIRPEYVAIYQTDNQYVFRRANR